MTFYYGDQKANRNGMDVGPFTYLGARHFRRGPHGRDTEKLRHVAGHQSYGITSNTDEE
jgi:hypothetical protein